MQHPKEVCVRIEEPKHVTPPYLYLPSSTTYHFCSCIQRAFNVGTYSIRILTHTHTRARNSYVITRIQYYIITSSLPAPAALYIRQAQINSRVKFSSNVTSCCTAHPPPVPLVSSRHILLYVHMYSCRYLIKATAVILHHSFLSEPLAVHPSHTCISPINFAVFRINRRRRQCFARTNRYICVSKKKKKEKEAKEKIRVGGVRARKKTYVYESMYTTRI